MVSYGQSAPNLWIYHRRQPKHLTSVQGWLCTVSQEQAQPNGCFICPLPADNFFYNQNPSIACSKHNTLLEFVCLEGHLFPNEADSKIQGAFVGKSDKAKSDKPKLYVKVQRAHDLRNMEPRLQLLTFWKIGGCEDNDVVWRLWINVKEIVFNSQSATHPWATAFWACNVAHGAITINQPANHIPSTFTGRNLHENLGFWCILRQQIGPLRGGAIWLRSDSCQTRPWGNLRAEIWWILSGGAFAKEERRKGDNWEATRNKQLFSL